MFENVCVCVRVVFWGVHVFVRKYECMCESVYMYVRSLCCVWQSVWVVCDSPYGCESVCE